MSEDERAHDEVARRRAAHFKQVRKSHQTEVAEDYVELIAELLDNFGEARLVDLAKHLGVTSATVNKTIGKLQQEGLVETKYYRAIFLTPRGRRLARASRQRHEIVQNFLMALGVSKEVAAADAEGIEHHVSRETLQAFSRVLRRNHRS